MTFMLSFLLTDGYIEKVPHLLLLYLNKYYINKLYSGTTQLELLISSKVINN